MQTFKLFVSSPGDVTVERRRVENIVSRLNGEFAEVARLEAIRWETEFYQAYSTFQAQIPRSADCDIVIGILKWRLGTALPPDFAEKLPNGQPFPSGTAYEILTAIEKRQKGAKLPDIYVFRFVDGSPPVPLDDPNRADIERDWRALKGFFQEWFLTDRGYFKAAFNSYTSEDDFEAQLEKLLRKWVADNVAGGRVVLWPIEVKGSPFCGLAAFGSKHTPVFFGRGHDTTRCLDLWQQAGDKGSPYLLVVGTSGSGKSSLVRAGIIPRLTTPGVVKEVDVWRIAVMRPGDSPAGPFAALARALMQDEASLPKEEEGRGPALPEIGQGESKTPAELTAVLHHSDAAVGIKPILNALTRVAAGEHDRGRYNRDVRCDLVLLIDQFEELFAASVSEAERISFIDLMVALAGTGRIWVAATIRAEFYARMLDQPALKKLKELGATYDLAFPGPVELAETVRSPAEAAGLVFETNAATGEHLDDRLLQDADRPDMLPLVQLALSRLFEGRETVGGEIWLAFKVYERLGGLKGIINEAGETALASLNEIEKAQLPRLLRQLAVPAHERDATRKGALTIRAVPLTQAAADEPGRALLYALVTSRLLSTSGIEAETQVRLTHQRVLEDWGRARTIVADSADFYRIRDDMDESHRRWEMGKHRSELLIPRGLPLAEAESIVGKYGDELTPEVRAYVKASRRRANLGQMIAWGAAAVFLLLFIVAVVEAGIASNQRTRAEAALAATTQMANAMIFDIGVKMGGFADLRSQILDRAIEAYGKAIKLDPTYGAAYNGLGAAYFGKHDYDKAIANYTYAIALDPRRAVTYYNRGLAYDIKRDRDKAIVDYTQAITLNPKIASYYENRAISYRFRSEYDHAIDDYTSAIELDPKNASYYKGRGSNYGSSGDFDHAIADYTKAITLNSNDDRAYVDRGNAYFQRGNFDQAIADYSSAITLDPQYNNAYIYRGDVYLRKGNFDQAIADYSSLVTLDPEDALAYIRRGDAYLRKGDFDYAIADYSSAITLHPEYAKAYNERCNAYRARANAGDLDQAIADCTQAITLDPEFALAYYNRGVAYRDRANAGDLDQAIADCTQAITLDPEEAYAYIMRANVYAIRAKAGDLEQAIVDYTQAMALAPKDSAPHFNRALAYLYAGSLSKALADLNQSRELDPTDPYAAIWLDIVTKRSKLTSQLAQAVTQIDMSKWPAPVIRLYLGEMTANAVLAAADDTDAKTKKVRTCEANFYIGELSLQEDKKNDAARLFQIAAAGCPKSFTELWAAEAELKALAEH